jgi:hypothetical protein
MDVQQSEEEDVGEKMIICDEVVRNGQETG